MLRLLASEIGRYGVIRRYLHPRLGEIKTVTTWREPGAEIVRLYRTTRRALSLGRLIAGKRGAAS